MPMMNNQILNLKAGAFQPERISEDSRIAFFKCIRWQAEETMDPINCLYHYFCDSSYPGDYPPYVDVLVLLFTIVSYISTLAIMVIDISRKGQSYLGQSKRFLLPSGPVTLPIILLVLAKGYRINAIFPVSAIGPAILQLLHVSALTFDLGVDRDVRYAFFEASTISGILHASLYLDSVILPYYTGFDALVSSQLSGECLSCVCRTEPLVVGGRLVTYRGWSATTFLVVSTLCSRIVYRMTGEQKCKFKSIKYLLESLCWISITWDCIYLLRKAPPERSMNEIAAFGGILSLISLHLIKKLSTQLTQQHQRLKN